MRALLTLGLLFILTLCAGAQDIQGIWQGVLDTGKGKLTIVFHVAGLPGEWTAKLDSPDQGARGIPVDEVVFADDVMELSIRKLGATYKGTLAADGASIVGTFTQGAAMKLDLARVEEVKGPNRPQTPKPPFDYVVEDVVFSHDPKQDTVESFRGGAGLGESDASRVKLAGTLTMPQGDGPFPAVVLVSGSGPQDRDQMLFSHRPFWVLADAFTRAGIAVLRYDDRGFGKSTGSFTGTTTAGFAQDALAAVQLLKGRKEIAADKVGIVGHSEGGIVAPMVAASSKDVAFVVALAGTAVPGGEVINHQMALLQSLRGAAKEVSEEAVRINNLVFAELAKRASRDETVAAISEIFGKAWDDTPDARGGQDRDAFVQVRLARVTSPWFREFILHDPRPDLRRVTCPFFGVFGEKDFQVAPDQNLPEMKKALADNPHATLVVLPSLNHLFQTCETGSIDEYSEIEETFAPAAIAAVVAWIHARTKPQ